MVVQILAILLALRAFERGVVFPHAMASILNADHIESSSQQSRF